MFNIICGVGARALDITSFLFDFPPFSTDLKNNRKLFMRMRAAKHDGLPYSAKCFQLSASPINICDDDRVLLKHYDIITSATAAAKNSL